MNELGSDGSAAIVFQDEVHFSIQSTIMRSWSPKGSRPKVKSYAGRKNASYSGFVLPESGELFVSRPAVFNWQTTIESIRAFLSSSAGRLEGRRIILVMDNAPWHRKARRLVSSCSEYQDIRDKVSMVSLPPYSPDLNPIEQVWRITRREKTHNRFWKDIDTLSSMLDSWFESFGTPDAKLRSFCSFKTN